MDRPSIRILAAVVLSALAACCLPGCHYAYHYEMRGTIRECSSGSPMAGVRVTLAASNHAVSLVSVMTGVDGVFSLRFNVYDGDFLPGRMTHWSLTLAKKGYIDEIVDVSPIKAPESVKATNQIAVVACLRAKP